MPNAEAFVATVGTQLIEYTSSQPWRAALPPALVEARGWYLPSDAGPRCLFVLACDHRSVDEIALAIADWDLWMGSVHASEAALMLTWEADRPTERIVPLMPPETPWPVWLVDLGAHSIFRTAHPADEQPFLQLADQLAGSYFQGTRMKPEDLTEQEMARVEGRPPFRAFLAGQNSPATWVLLVIIGVYFAATELAGGSTNTTVMLRAGTNFRPLIESGEWWRLVTANFLHFGWMHLAVNAYSLYAVGPMLEKLYGTSKYVAIYVFAGIAGAVASMVIRGGHSAGASGALFGLLGAMLVIGLRHQSAIPAHFRKEMRTIALVTLVINLIMGFTVPAIDNYAHLGGLVGGFLLALLLGPSPALVGKRSHPGARLALATLPALAAVALGLGIAAWTTGKPMLATELGPAGDFAVRVPVEALYGKTATDLYLSKDGNEHWIVVTSHENQDARPAKGGPGLTGSTLEAYMPGIAAALVEGATAAEPPTVVTRGAHRFIRVVKTTPAGREEAYVTATAKRLYVIQTKGLSSEAWMRPALDQALDSFEPRTP
jgi:membrane associated rhomboid family serine protease